MRMESRGRGGASDCGAHSLGAMRDPLRSHTGLLGTCAHSMERVASWVMEAASGAAPAAPAAFGPDRTLLIVCSLACTVALCAVAVAAAIMAHFAPVRAKPAPPSPGAEAVLCKKLGCPHSSRLLLAATSSSRSLMRRPASDSHAPYARLWHLRRPHRCAATCTAATA